jgi:hypothetical protein
MIFNYPGEALKFLENNDIKELKGFLDITNYKEYNQDIEDALNYLCNEWDYCTYRNKPSLVREALER